MTNLVNIVHPYTLKLLGEDLILCPIEEFEERDEKIVEFIRSALDLKARVLKHDSNNGMIELMAYGAISLDPIFRDILKDKRIRNVFTISTTGLPLPEQKPDYVTSLESWRMAKKIISSNSKLKRSIGSPKRTFYIGGYFDVCIKNMALHQRKHYTPKKEIFYVEDLCVVGDSRKEKNAREELLKANINSINYEEAMKLLQT